MSRTPGQNAAGEARDLSDIKRMYERARNNTTRPERENKQLIAHLKAAMVIMVATS